ncbi:MAG TPA: carboxymuconolactone decarboxylase family protein [Stellaceae bacterium]|nr:carboxymuconolactone decarboxylase family protein [Stellaceae bacterium]
MPRIAPLPAETLPELADLLDASRGRMGFVPNSQLIMAHRPEILRGFVQLASAINGPGSSIEPQLRNLVSQMASRASGCGYCMAHTAHTAGRVGVPEAKEDALWEYETSPLFSDAERAALRVAHGAAQVPNAVTDEDFNELKRYYTDAQIVDIVAVIALFGFLNRFNDTMATELESSPIEAGRRFLAQKGWTVGKHAG